MKKTSQPTRQDLCTQAASLAVDQMLCCTSWCFAVPLKCPWLFIEPPSGFHRVLPVSELHNRISLAFLTLSSSEGTEALTGESSADSLNSETKVTWLSVRGEEGATVGLVRVSERSTCRENKMRHET